MSGEIGSGSTISGINVTPLVDVMLVLLVIFMVTAPIIQQGVPVDLPEVTAEPLPGDESALVVSVTGDGEVYLADEAVELDALGAEVLALVKEMPGRPVYLRADHRARYGAVVAVMAELRRVGIKNLGMITDPEAA